MGYRVQLMRVKTCAAHVAPIPGTDELAHVAPIAHPWQMCADELSPIVQAGKTRADEQLPIAQVGRMCR